MKKSITLKALTVGFIQGMLLLLLNYCYISQYFKGIQIELFFIICILFATISSVLYYLFIRKQSTNRAMIAFSVISIFSFIVILGIAFICLLSLSNEMIPQRETNNVDGLVILLFSVVYIAVTELINLSIFIGIAIRNKKRYSSPNE